MSLLHGRRFMWRPFYLKAYGVIFLRNQFGCQVQTLTALLASYLAHFPISVKPCPQAELILA